MLLICFENWRMVQQLEGRLRCAVLVFAVTGLAYAHTSVSLEAASSLETLLGDVCKVLSCTIWRLCGVIFVRESLSLP